jgi:hypothetical protein
VASLTAREWQDSDVQALVACLRAADVAMLMGTHAHETPEALILHCVGLSSYLRTIVLDDRVVGVFGIAIVVPHNIGVPWMITSPAIEQVPVQFVRKTRAFLKEACTSFTQFLNFEPAENTLHLRWLRAIGFEVAADPEPFGVDRKPFYRFWLNQG